MNRFGANLGMGRTGGRRGGGSSAAAAASGNSYVLRFPGGSPTLADPGPHVDHDVWWPYNTEITAAGEGFRWEAWVAPYDAGYWVSHTASGAHAMLAGWTRSGDHFIPTGNIWDGAALVPFGGNCSDGVALGRWHHFMVEYQRGDMNRIVCRVDGIIVAVSPYSGTRWSPASSFGRGFLGMGGSDHQGAPMRLAAVRVFDKTWPDVNAVFWQNPRRVYRRPGMLSDNGTRPDLLVDYTGALRAIYADVGFHTRPPTASLYQYAGVVRHSSQAAGYAGPLLEAVDDPDCMFFREDAITDYPYVVKAARTMPVGAAIWDDFKGHDVTCITHPANTGSSARSLGSTKAGGSMGAIPWQTITYDGALGSGYWWSRFCERAVYDGNQTIGPLFVPFGAANMDVRTTHFGLAGRSSGTGSGEGAGVAARVSSDGKSFWYWRLNANDSCYLDRWNNLAIAEQYGPFAVPADWDGGLRMTCIGDELTCYARKADGTWSQLHQRTSSSLNTETRAGIATTNSHARFDDFAVLAA